MNFVCQFTKIPKWHWVQGLYTTTWFCHRQIILILYTVQKLFMITISKLCCHHRLPTHYHHFFEFWVTNLGYSFYVTWIQWIQFFFFITFCGFCQSKGELPFKTEKFKLTCYIGWCNDEIRENIQAVCFPFLENKIFYQRAT